MFRERVEFFGSAVDDEAKTHDNDEIQDFDSKNLNRW